MKAAKQSTKVTREITQKQKKRETTIKLLIVSLALTVLVFTTLLIIQSNILDKEETAYVAVVAQDIDAGMKITEDNINDFIKIEERVINTLPELYITRENIRTLLNQFIEKNYKVNEVITSDVLTYTRYEINTIENPVEVSFSVSQLYNAVGGILREGDRVNLYNTITTSVYGTQETISKPIMLNAYISKALTSSGAEVPTSDKSTNATMFNIVISHEVEADFNIAIANGTLRLSKILYTDEDEANRDSLETPDSSTGGVIKQPEPDPSDITPPYEIIGTDENNVNTEENTENQDENNEDLTDENEDTENSDEDNTLDNEDTPSDKDNEE